MGAAYGIPSIEAILLMDNQKGNGAMSSIYNVMDEVKREVEEAEYQAALSFFDDVIHMWNGRCSMETKGHCDCWDRVVNDISDMCEDCVREYLDWYESTVIVPVETDEK